MICLHKFLIKEEPKIRNLENSYNYSFIDVFISKRLPFLIDPVISNILSANVDFP